MRPVDIIRYIDEHNFRLDVRETCLQIWWNETSRKHVEKQLVTSLADLPRLRHFYTPSHGTGQHGELA